MSLFDELKGLAAQYTGGGTPQGDPSAHFDQVSKTVDPSALAEGIVAAMRSDETPPFSQLVSQLFSNGSADQKATMLNAILGAAPQLRQLVPGLGSGGTVNPQQATTISPDTVQNLAHQAEQHNPSVVDKLSSVYANHPTLVKTLGTAAMAIAIRKVTEKYAA
jgi:hypothetical protein